MLTKINFVFIMISLLLIPSEIRAENAVADPATQDATVAPWTTIKTENYTLYYGKDYEDDAQRAKDYLDKTIESLTHEFSEHEPEKLLKNIDCHFYLHPEPNEQAFDGRSVCMTRGLEDGTRYAEIHFLTPAQYGPDSKNRIGEFKKSNDVFFRYIVHEYCSVWLGVIVRSKEKGWQEHQAPNWFWQGYEEYLGMMHSNAHNRTVTFSKYMALLKEDPDRVMVAYGYRDKTPRLVVEDDYADGFALLAFMHERYGKKAVQQIMTSEKATFREAMRNSFQMDDAVLYEEFEKWVQDWKGQ